MFSEPFPFSQNEKQSLEEAAKDIMSRGLRVPKLILAWMLQGYSDTADHSPGFCMGWGFVWCQGFYLRSQGYDCLCCAIGLGHTAGVAHSRQI